MTRHKSFKRLVRARMEKTGESYTAARAMLLAAEKPAASEPPALATSDEKIRREDRARAGRSGSTCSTSGAPPSVRTRRSRAGWPSSSRSSRWPGTRRRSRGATSAPAACVRSASAPTVSRSPRRRPWPWRPSGCSTRSSMTPLGARWLPDGELRERTATKPKSARFDWAGGDDPGQRRLRAEGRGEEHGGPRARATRRRRRGRADEGVLARASERAQVAARGR